MGPNERKGSLEKREIGVFVSGSFSVVIMGEQISKLMKKHANDIKSHDEFMKAANSQKLYESKRSIANLMESSASSSSSDTSTSSLSSDSSSDSESSSELSISENTNQDSDIVLQNLQNRQIHQKSSVSKQISCDMLANLYSKTYANPI